MSSKIKYRIGIVMLSLVLFSCKKEPGHHGQNPHEGFIYTMGNDETGNTILSYQQQKNGLLSYQSATASGGKGNGAGLGSQGSIVIDANHHWLYAVNAGSNSISSFKIKENGDLILAYTVSSKGVLPVSVTVHDNKLYVVNSTSSDISGYTIGSGGLLTPIAGSVLSLSSTGAGPAQIKFTPDGGKLVVTEKNNNKITTYLVDASGLAKSLTSYASAGQTPLDLILPAQKRLSLPRPVGEQRTQALFHLTQFSTILW